MSDTVITVDKLSKLYRIGTAAQRHDSLRELIMSAATAPLRRLRRLGEASAADAGAFWALKDVSFEVKRGEVLGIIGRNGAGKSTLLKILSRIVEPTEGRVRMRGRVASLLEVGTGFHPELTGRENIYLNGAILGMKKAEIDRKFDEIVAFSEIEKFLDTPVKRYSSGMYVRLAFAVAAHLDPEILICDEVLAVGDAAFQKKCLGKMQEVSRGQGRTVLFVSHNMAAVQALCGSAMLLRNGACHYWGRTRFAVERYLAGTDQCARNTLPGKYDLTQRKNPYLPESLIIQWLTVTDSTGQPTECVGMGQPLTLSIGVSELSQFRGAQVGVIFKTLTEQWLANFNTGMKPPKMGPRSPLERVTLRIPRIPFLPGSYWIDISIAQKGIGRLDYVDRAAPLQVIDHDVYGTGYSPGSGDGVIYLDGDWEIVDHQLTLAQS